MGKLELIEEAQDTVNRMTMRAANAKAEHDSAKKLLDQALKRRDQIIAIGEAALNEQTPLFPPEESNGHAKAAAKKKPTKAEANEAAIKAAEARPGSTGGWRSVPLVEVFTYGAVRNYFECDGISTLGPVIDKLEKGFKFQDIPGVGAEKAAKCADQLADFRKKNPQWVF